MSDKSNMLLFPIYKNGMEVNVEVWFLETLVREVYFTTENRWFDKVAQLPTNYAGIVTYFPSFPQGAFLSSWRYLV